ncbi:hypothetical protein EB796_023853 [Bugula neritina]|uniref:Uncharacterized protein n=1 Tax=Bugula neritina TaxID=10212 RepID=A0A7J7IVA7_BUGNE|nr:hypothetical protein EB796_023853 [Bugula neritina]
MRNYASGLWCGFWMFCTGVCGCTIRVGQPSDKNNRTRIVVCLASGFNAIIFCPVQIALYAFLFTPEKAWFNELYLVQPVWWAVMFQSIGIFSGVASLFICVATLVVALRTKPYAGEARTWNEMDL